MSQQLQARAAAAARLRKDLARKDNPAFVGCMEKPLQGARILCMTITDIPCKYAGFGEKKQISAVVLVVNCIMEGWQKVPLESGKGNKLQTGPDPISLTKRVQWAGDESGSLSAMEFKPFRIISGCPTEKGKAPPEIEWLVQPGDVHRWSIWADSTSDAPNPSKFSKNLLPTNVDVIPMGALVEFVLGPRGWSPYKPGDINPDNGKEREICPVTKGYGMGLSSIKYLEHASAYSVLDKLGMILPDNLEAMKARQQLWQTKFTYIKDILELEKVPFFIKVANTTTNVELDERPEMKDEPPQIRLTGWCPEGMPNSSGESMHPVDVLHTDAMAATNCPDIQSACALLQMAFEAGAASLVVCSNPYRPGTDRKKSMYYGIPLIDTRVLLKGLEVPTDPEMLKSDETDRYFVFKSTFEMLLPAGVPQKKRKRKGGSDGEEEEEEEDDEEEEPTSVQTPLIMVSKEPFTSIKGEFVAKTPDLVLVGPNVQLAKGYYIRFVHPDVHSLVLWSGYITLSRPQVTGPDMNYNILACAADAAAAFAAGGAGAGGGKKRNRWSSGAAAASIAFDPFASASSSPPQKDVACSQVQMQQQESENDAVENDEEEEEVREVKKSKNHKKRSGGK